MRPRRRGSVGAAPPAALRRRGVSSAAHLEGRKDRHRRHEGTARSTRRAAPPPPHIPSPEGTPRDGGCDLPAGRAPSHPAPATSPVQARPGAALTCCYCRGRSVPGAAARSRVCSSGSRRGVAPGPAARRGSAAGSLRPARCRRLPPLREGGRGGACRRPAHNPWWRPRPSAPRSHWTSALRWPRPPARCAGAALLLRAVRCGAVRTPGGACAARAAVRTRMCMGACTPRPVICTVAGVRMKQLYGLAGDTRRVPQGRVHGPVRSGTTSCARCRHRGVRWPGPAAVLRPRAASVRAPELPMAERVGAEAEGHPWGTRGCG